MKQTKNQANKQTKQQPLNKTTIYRMERDGMLLTVVVYE